MSKIPLIFPHPYNADSDGLLCFYGDLDPRRLLLAYQFGIFPWYSEGHPIMWWFTSPRLVLYPSSLKVSKSMRNILNRDNYTVTFDTAFTEVISACKHISRMGQDGTWINEDMIAAYSALYQQGYAHSVEVWEDNTLIGGLYGISLGKIFYGESMFSAKSNASKIAFIHLVRYLQVLDYKLIDCQQDTPHLRSLGAELIDKETFMSHLRTNALVEHNPGKWEFINQ